MNGCTLRRGNLEAIVSEKGELVSLARLSVGERLWEEYLHPGGRADAPEEDRAGWGNTEIVMYPIVGPALDGVVHARGEEVPMGQHGISRHLPWLRSDLAESSATYRQMYPAHNQVPNRPGKEPRTMEWPYSFTIDKRLELTEGGLRVRFTLQNCSDSEQPYQFGWHPAFAAETSDRIFNSEASQRVLGDRAASAAELAQSQKIGRLQQAEGAVAFLRNSAELYLADPLRGPAYSRLMLHNFGRAMVWSPPGSRLVCLEPVTDLPRKNAPVEFSRTLPPHGIAFYDAEIFLR